MRIRTVMTLLAALLPAACWAQRWSVSTNVADWLTLGTLNVSGSAAVARHVTVNAEARYNPWTFNGGDAETQMQMRHQTYAAGARWWPWYVYSGWWLGSTAQYMQYNRGGVFSSETEEGDAFGLAVSGGYTMMLHRNLNVEFGAAFWGGYTLYTSYACPRCGRVTGSGGKWFVLPSGLIASLVWVF